MNLSDLLTAGVGIMILGLVVRAIWTGAYQSRGNEQITRSDNPRTFWTVMAIFALFGAALLLGAAHSLLRLVGLQRI